MQALFFVLFGYLAGSILWAHVFSGLLKKENVVENSRDQNPGTANAFVHGGFWCGMLTLLGDVLKGFLPVFLYLYFAAGTQRDISLLPLVLAAPVVGHAFPLFYRFRGGKGIAVTFGCLLGLMPLWQPFVILAVIFIFLSLVFRISPHFYRTLAAYFSTLLGIVFLVELPEIAIGFLLITVIVFIRMFMSKEEKEKIKVKLLWMR